MGKPFNNELSKLQHTVEYINGVDVQQIRDFMLCDSWRNLICIGSGGSFSACHYASLLYKKHCGFAVPYTPLQMQWCDDKIWEKSKLLFLSASGRNHDIQYSFKKGLQLSNKIANICLRNENPLEVLSHKKTDVVSFNLDIPSGKDGFLATNSLVALYCLVYKCFHGEYDVKSIFRGEEPYVCRNLDDLGTIQNFSVLYGEYGEPVAYDIESKMSEAALGTAQLTDFRNFGHGRHHWFDKRGDGSCILVLVTPEDEELANKTIECMPEDIPVIYIKSSVKGELSSLDLLVKSFSLIRDVGIERGIDPGKPGVPEYGKTLYNLHFAKVLCNPEVPDNLMTAIMRKCHKKSILSIDDKSFEYYKQGLNSFIGCLNDTSFDGIVFDYDGTICAPEYRFRDELDPKILKQILKLLKGAIHIYIATGRGKSIYKNFRELSTEYPGQITIAYYNGMIVCDASEEVDWDYYKKAKLHSELESLVKELKKKCWLDLKFEDNGVVQVDCRCKQITIKTKHNTDEVYELCQEIVKSKGLRNINIWRSTHSVDIVVARDVNKKNVFDNNEKLLCIGDCGSVNGNDFELLSTPYSLSVGTVSRSVDSCWNIAPYGKRGVDATLWYLRHLVCCNGKLKTRFAI